MSNCIKLVLCCFITMVTVITNVKLCKTSCVFIVFMLTIKVIII